MDDSAPNNTPALCPVPTNNPPTLIINDDWKTQYEKDLVPLSAWEKEAISASKAHGAEVPTPSASNLKDLENLCDLEEGIKEFETIQEDTKHDRFFRLQFGEASAQKSQNNVGNNGQTVFPSNDWSANNSFPSHHNDDFLKEFNYTVKEKTDKNGRDFFLFDDSSTFSSVIVIISKAGGARFVLLNNVLLQLKDLLNLESCVEAQRGMPQFENDEVTLTLADKRLFTIKGIGLRLMSAVLCHLSQRYAI